jgi:hypothetical protein
MIKRKEFRAPTEKPVKIWSDDLFHSAYITDEWQLLREDLWRAAYAEGCISKDMAVKGFDKEQTLAAIKMEEVKYEEQVEKIIRELIEEGDIHKLDSLGRPKVHVIGDQLGRIPTAQLRDKIFNKVKEI